METWNGLAPYPEKNREGYFRSEGSQPHTGPRSRVPVSGRRVCINTGCKNQWGLRLEERNCWNPKRFLLKSPWTAHCLNSNVWSPVLGKQIKRHQRYTGRTELSGNRWELGGSFLPERSASRGYCFSFEPPPFRASRQVPYLRPHQSGSHCLPYPGDSLRVCQIQLLGPPKLFLVSFL